jgi:hypothetical protein
MQLWIWPLTPKARGMADGRDPGLRRDDDSLGRPHPDATRDLAFEAEGGAAWPLAEIPACAGMTNL